jgi:hypothetical protein
MEESLATDNRDVGRSGVLRMKRRSLIPGVILACVFATVPAEAQEGDTVARLRVEIELLLDARVISPGRPENLEKTVSLIEEIAALYERYPAESARLLLLMHQYSGGEDGHCQLSSGGIWRCCC